LAENWSWARDLNGRDRDETETSASRDQRRDRDVDNFWYDSRPSRDRDVETETAILEKANRQGEGRLSGGGALVCGAFVRTPILTTQITYTLGAAGVLSWWYNYFTSSLK